MSRCIIHVGMQKTGSTSIQYSLAPLDDATHLYADISGRVNHSVAVYSAFARRPERHPKIRQRGLDEAALEAFVRQARQELRNAVERAAGRTLIISGEGLVGLKPGELERLKGFFERRSVDVEIVAYVRGPAGYMSSSFQQRLKSTKISEFDPAQLYPFYRSRFEKFDEVFGRDKVRLWRFDPASFPEGSVVRDFCSRTGIDFAHVQEVRKNDSMSREVAGLLYGYGFWLRENRKPKLFADQAAKLSDLFRELPATRFRLAPSVVRPILAENREDLDWMERRLGQSLDEAIGEDRASDVTEEADLLKPVPGAARLLMATLATAGADVPRSAEADVNLLIERFCQLKPSKKPWSKREAGVPAQSPSVSTDEAEQRRKKKQAKRRGQAKGDQEPVPASAGKARRHLGEITEAGGSGRRLKKKRTGRSGRTAAGSGG